MTKKKPYIFKKHDAMSKSDPIANWHGIEDEKIHSKEIEKTFGKSLFGETFGLGRMIKGCPPSIPEDK